MEKSKFDFKSIQSKIHLEYGIELDETTICILFVLQTSMSQNQNELNKSLKNYIEQQNRAISELGSNINNVCTLLNTSSEKINKATNGLELDNKHPRSQAFYHGLGRFGVSSLFAIVIFSVFYFLYYSDKKEKEQLPYLLSWYAKYYEISQKSNKKEMAQFLNHFPKPN